MAMITGNVFLFPSSLRPPRTVVLSVRLLARSASFWLGFRRVARFIQGHTKLTDECAHVPYAKLLAQGSPGEFKATRNTSKNLLNLLTSRRGASLIASPFFFLKDYYGVFPYRVVQPITATAKGEGRWFTKAFHNISLIYTGPKKARDKQTCKGRKIVSRFTSHEEKKHSLRQQL